MTWGNVSNWFFSTLNAGLTPGICWWRARWSDGAYVRRFLHRRENSEVGNADISQDYHRNGVVRRYVTVTVRSGRSMHQASGGAPNSTVLLREVISYGQSPRGRRRPCSARARREHPGSLLQ